MHAVLDTILSVKGGKGKGKGRADSKRTPSSNNQTGQADASSDERKMAQERQSKPRARSARRHRLRRRRRSIGAIGRFAKRIGDSTSSSSSDDDGEEGSSASSADSSSSSDTEAARSMPDQSRSMRERNRTTSDASAPPASRFQETRDSSSVTEPSRVRSSFDDVAMVPGVFEVTSRAGGSSLLGTAGDGIARPPRLPSNGTDDSLPDGLGSLGVALTPVQGRSDRVGLIEMAARNRIGSLTPQAMRVSSSNTAPLRGAETMQAF